MLWRCCQLRCVGRSFGICWRVESISQIQKNETWNIMEANCFNSFFVFFEASTSLAHQVLWAISSQIPMSRSLQKRLGPKKSERPPKKRWVSTLGTPLFISAIMPQDLPATLRVQSDMPYAFNRFWEFLSQLTSFEAHSSFISKRCWAAEPEPLAILQLQLRGLDEAASECKRRFGGYPALPHVMMQPGWDVYPGISPDLSKATQRKFLPLVAWVRPWPGPLTLSLLLQDRRNRRGCHTCHKQEVL